MIPLPSMAKKTVAVLGLGRSGRSVCRALRESGALAMQDIHVVEVVHGASRRIRSTSCNTPTPQQSQPLQPPVPTVEPLHDLAALLGVCLKRRLWMRPARICCNHSRCRRVGMRSDNVDMITSGSLHGNQPPRVQHRFGWSGSMSPSVDASAPAGETDRGNHR